MINEFDMNNNNEESKLNDTNNITGYNKEESNDSKPINTADTLIEGPLELLEVETDQINKFDLIPDYITKTSSKYPYVIKTPKGSNCLDGFNLVEEAIKQGQTKMTVYMESWTSHSDDDLSRRKIELRNTSDFGKVYYIETMRHIAFRKKLLMEKNPNLIEFRQGMSGKGIDNSSKLHYWLAKERNIDDDTVSKYLTDIRYLSMDAMDILIEFQKKPKKEVGEYPNKDFFEIIRKKKVAYIDEIEGLNLEYSENERLVSEKVLEAYEKHRKKLKIEEFSSTLKHHAEIIKSSSYDLYKQIIGQPVSTEKESSTANSETSNTEDEGKKDNENTANSVDNQIKEFATELLNYANENTPIEEKKDQYNKFAMKLLLLVGSI